MPQIQDPGIGRLPKRKKRDPYSIQVIQPPESWAKAAANADITDIWDRFSAFDSNTIEKAAGLVGNVVFGPAPTSAVMQFGQSASRVYDWLDTNNRFAGVQGVLMRARINALNEDDPTVRQQKLDFIHALRRLPTEQQNLFLLAAGGNPLITTVQQAATATLGPGFETTAEGVVADPTKVAAARLAAIKQMFPSLPLDITTPEKAPTQAELIDNILNEFRGHYGAVIDPMLDKYKVLTDSESSVAAKVLAGVQMALMGLYTVPATGLATASTVFSYAEETSGGNPVLSSIRGAGHEVMGGVNTAFAGMNGGVSWVLGLVGIDPNSPVGRELSQTITLAGTIGLAHGLRSEARFIKTARSMEPEAAAEYLKNAYEPRSGPLGALADVVGAPTRALHDWGVQFALKFIKDPEAYYNGRAGTRLIDTLWEIKEKYAESATGEVARAGIKNFPIEIARDLLELPSKEAMRFSLIDQWKNPGFRTLPKLESRLAGVRSSIEDIITKKARGSTEEGVRRIVEQQQHLAQEAADLQTELTAARRAGESGAGVNEMARRLGEIRSALSRLESDRNQLSLLEAQERVLEHQISVAQESPPTYRYPSINRTRMASIAPVTRAQRVANTFLLGKFNVFKAVNELPRLVKLWVPGLEAPIDWLAQNASAMVKVFELAKLPRDIQRTLLTDLVENVKNRQQLFEWGIRARETMTEYLPKNTPPEIRSAIERMTKDPLEGRYRTIVTEDATTANGGTRYIRHHVIEREVAPGEFIPEPSIPTEFLEQMTIADVDLLTEATSLIRRGKNAMAAAGESIAGQFGKTLATAWYTIPRFIAEVTTNIMKPGIMIERLPAMGMRIQLEQMLRNVMFGNRAVTFPNGIALFPGGIPVPWTTLRVGERIFGPDGWELLGKDPRYKGIPMENGPHDLGMFQGEISGSGGQHILVPEDTLEYRLGINKNVPTRIYKGWLDRMEQAHTDRFLRTFAYLDLDITKMKAALVSDTQLARFVETELKPVLEKTGMTQDQWLEGWKKYLEQTTGGDPVYLDAIATGRLPGELPLSESATVVRDRFTGRSVVDEYNKTVHDIETINTRLAELNRKTDIQTISVLQRQRRSILYRQQELVSDYGPELELVAPDYVSLSKSRAMTRRLKSDFEEGKVDMPGVIATERLGSDAVPLNVAETARAMSWAFSETVYRGFKPLNWLDQKLTRGSLYRQLLEREVRTLRKLGVPEDDAVAWAQVRAAEATRDIMYDLSARTSLQRSLKDVFWFAPAWQEVLYTWLVKIPSESYWPIGALTMAAEGSAFLGLLRQFGVVRKDANGEDIIPFPGLSKVVEKLTGTKIPELVFAKVSGFNLVTSGGFAPGLSPFPNYLLGKTATGVGGPFKALSDVLQPYGPETSVLPQPITYFFEALTGNPPPVFASSEYAKTQHDRAFDQALQYAFHDLGTEGKSPPRPEDYADITSEVTGEPALSPAAEEKYFADQKAYVLELFDLANQYHRGIAFMKLIGSTVSPASLYVTSADREAYQKFWNEVVVPAGFDPEGGMRQKQRDLIDQFLVDHPNSLAYATYYNTIGEQKRELPWEDAGDAAYWEKLYTGEMRVLSPEAFARKLQYTESWRLYISQLDQAMSGIGDTAPEQLTRGFERNAALLDYREKWNRYLALNPDAEADIAKSRRLFDEKYGKPTRSYEIERLGETVYLLNRASEMFTGETGIRTDEVKAVLAQLKELYSATGEFGAPATDAEKGRAWYFDKVLQPYFDETAPLYEQAADLTQRGLYAGAIYDQIRAIGERYADKRHGGLVYPSPEEVFYGNRSPQEKDAARMVWATRPPTWLSDFQYDTVGYERDANTAPFLAAVREFEAAFQQTLVDRNVSASSKEYDYYQKYRTQQLSALARQYDEGDLLRLYLATPAERLSTTGFGSGNSTWTNTLSAANQVVSTLQAAGLSPKGFSQEAVYYKTWLYNVIQKQREADPEFDRLMVQLSYAIPDRGNTYREGVPLYEAVFFGNFNTDFIPPELAAIGAS